MILRRSKLVIIDDQVCIVYLDGEALLVVKIVTSAIWLQRKSRAVLILAVILQ